MSALNKNDPYSSSLTKIDVVSDKKKKLDSINDQLDHGLNTKTKFQVFIVKTLILY